MANISYVEPDGYCKECNSYYYIEKLEITIIETEISPLYSSLYPKYVRSCCGRELPIGSPNDE